MSASAESPGRWKRDEKRHGKWTAEGEGENPERIVSFDAAPALQGGEGSLRPSYEAAVQHHGKQGGTAGVRFLLSLHLRTEMEGQFYFIERVRQIMKRLTRRWRGF